MPARKVFDAHFHIGPYGSQTVAGHAIRPIAPARDHRHGDDCNAYLARHGLRGGVVVPTYLEDQHAAFRYNLLVLDAVERHPALLGGLWVSPLSDVEDALDETLRALPCKNIRALKIASNTWQPRSIDPATWTRRMRRNMERILEAARNHALVIHFHTGFQDGAQPLAFAAFMREFGRAATYQFVHMGEAIAPVFAFVPRFIQWIERGFDVYTDTSLVPGFGPPWLLRALDRHNLGFGRVLFATDAPWGRFAGAYAKVASMNVGADVLDHLLWRNGTRLYRFADTES